MRIDDEKMNDDAKYQAAQFYFEDGGMKALAAAFVWCGLVYYCADLDQGDLSGTGLAELAKSLLGIPTFYKKPGRDAARSMVSRIIRQNVESKKLAVSSYEWSQILAGLISDGEKLTVQEAIDIYNNSPEVVAHGGGGGKDRRFNASSVTFYNEKLLCLIGSLYPALRRTSRALVPCFWTPRSSMPLSIGSQ